MAQRKTETEASATAEVETGGAPAVAGKEDAALREEALPVSEADDGGQSRLTQEIRDLSDEDKPDPTTIAQEEVLKGEES